MQYSRYGCLVVILVSGWLFGQAPEDDGPAVGAEAGEAVALEALPAYRRGMDAMAGRMWKVAAARFDEALEAENLSEEDRVQIQRRHVEALIRAGNGAAAIEMLERPELAEDPENSFWRGQALIDLGRYRQAIEVLEPRTEKMPFWVESRMTLARLHQALGDLPKALATLDELLEKRTEFINGKLFRAKIWFDLGRYDEVVELVAGLDGLSPSQQVVANRLRARSHLELGQQEQAVTWFQKLVESPEHQSLSSYHGSIVDLARAQLKSGKREVAADRLLAFIQKHPESPLLMEAFNTLQACLPDKPSPNDLILNRIAEWVPAKQVSGENQMLGDAQHRAGAKMPGPFLADDSLEPYALYHMALGVRRQQVSGTGEEARRLLTRLRWEYPRHPLAYQALMRLGEWEIEAGEVERGRRYLAALADLVEAKPDLRSRAMSLEASILFERGEFEKAAQNFQRVAEFLEVNKRDEALRNAATAFLAAGNLDAFEQIVKEVERAELEQSLALERALYLTATRDPGALLRLLEFIERFPDHRRIAEARLNAALAALDMAPARVEVAAEQLEALTAEDRKNLPAESLVVADIRLRQHQRDWVGAAQRAKEFLEANPESSSWVLISFERGKALFQSKDFNDARLVFEELVKRDPDAVQAPAALLLAGRAAAEGGTPQSQRESLGIFEKLIEADTGYAGVARLEKADLHIRLTELEEAIELLGPWFDSMEDNDPLMYAAGMLLGDALVAHAQGRPEILERVLEVFDRLLAQIPAGSARQQRVLYQKGLALEQLEGRRDEALKVLMDVVQEAPDQARGDWDSVESCGFAALRILERREDWRAAKLLAERIARLNGPRAEEAAKRAKTIGLEHFIWDQSP